MFKTRAAFLVSNKWQWHTFTSEHANKHAAIIRKGAELGATGWDFGQADHEWADRAGF